MFGCGSRGRFHRRCRTLLFMCSRKDAFCCRTRSLAINQHEISDVHERTYALPGYKNGIATVDGISQGNQTPDQTHIPKCDRDTALSLSFRRNPLNNPPTKKQSLAQESDGNPYDLCSCHADPSTLRCEANIKKSKRSARRVVDPVTPDIVLSRGICTATRASASSARRSGHK